jgi:putative spermidine/putrescine transport system substrate-binding protein
VSFDTGPEWANWKALFAEFRKRYPKVEITYNDIGSAATVVALDKSRRRPQADTAYYFAASALDAASKDVVAPFRPINFDKLPGVFRAADGRWFAVHSLNIAFLVNRKLVKDVPQRWSDLLKPEYRNAVVYLDPRSTGQGQVAVFAAAYANGGGVDNPKPGAEFFGKLKRAGNVLRVEGTTPYAKFVKGEIPILIGYENDGLKAKYADGMGDAADVVIPQDGSVSAPYAMSLVKNGPNPSAAQLWLNLVMSDVGQALFAQGYVRPAVPGAGGAGRRGEAAECAAGSPARCREGGRAQGRGRPAVVAGHARQPRGSRCRLRYRNAACAAGALPAAALLAVCFVLPLAALVDAASGRRAGVRGGAARPARRRCDRPLARAGRRRRDAVGRRGRAARLRAGGPVAGRRHWSLALLGVPLAFSAS